jgi:twitching motility protein PilT
MRKIDKFLRVAVERRASDLHFSSDEPVRFRIDGELEIISDRNLSHEDITEIFFEILNEQERGFLSENQNLDKSFTAEGSGNFRLNIFFTRKGMSAVLRTIPSEIPSIEKLELPPVVAELCKLDKGLVLVTGPTGSGKSTTLAAMVNYINATSKCHILTVEDPVEFVHSSQMSLINQREIGGSCRSFADALKYALREDPDVILIGEMRDLETIALALTAAETGHLVFGTLHTRGAGPSVDRIIDSFPGNQQPMIRTMLSESLKAVISQALLKKASGKGRTAAYEIMVVNSAISNLIREGKTFQIPSTMQVNKKEGMVTMDQSLLELVSQQIVLPEVAASYLTNPSLLEGQLKSSKRGKSAGSSPVFPVGVSQVSESPKMLSGSKPSAILQSPQTPVPPKPPEIKMEPGNQSPPPMKKDTPPFFTPPSVKTAAPANPSPTQVKKVSLADSFKRLLDENEENSKESFDSMEANDQRKKKLG